MSEHSLQSEEIFDVFRLATFVQADHCPFPRADAAYLFGNTPDNEVAILGRGLALYCDETKPLLLCGGGPYRPPNSPPEAPVAYSGAEAWKQWLTAHCVEKEDIYVVSAPPLSHTGTEAYNLVTLAKERGWNVIYVVGCRTHMYRIFANMVNAVNQLYPDLLVYCREGSSLPWSEKIVFSQGSVGIRLHEVLEGEWTRSNKRYGNQYDPAGPGEMLAYILRRERLAAELMAKGE